LASAWMSETIAIFMSGGLGLRLPVVGQYTANEPASRLP
jgi:hypothetical protein